jgi:hypothetical protein
MRKHVAFLPAHVVLRVPVRSCLIEELNVALSEPNAQLARGASPLQAALRGFLLHTLTWRAQIPAAKGERVARMPMRKFSCASLCPVCRGLNAGHASAQLVCLVLTLHSARKSPKTIEPKLGSFTDASQPQHKCLQDAAAWVSPRGSDQRLRDCS